MTTKLPTVNVNMSIFCIYLLKVGVISCGECQGPAKPQPRPQKHRPKWFLPRSTRARHRTWTPQNPPHTTCLGCPRSVSLRPIRNMSAGYFPKREKVGLEDLFKGLVTASHILHRHDVLDAYGHVSVRSPDNAATFWMPCNMPPALISSPEDLVEYHVESAEAVEKKAKPGYIERHIHSEIYKRFPNINCVVHSHASDVLPYCVSGVPLKNTTHMAGFLGE